MVAVLNNDGTYYLCSDPRFYRHSALDKTLYYRKDLPSTPIDPSSPPIATGIHAGRNNIIFNMCIDSYSLNPNNILGTGANISLTPDPILFHENGTVYFSSTDECLFITDVIIDGVNFGAIGSYEFVNVTAPLPIIEVVTAHYQYEIAAIAHPNGFIDPPGIIEVNCRENITYTITPDEGYEISYVLVNGNNMGAIDTYTFNSVLSNETIEVFFNPKNSVNEQTIEGISIYCYMNIIYIANKNDLPINDITIFDMFGCVIWKGIPQQMQQIVLDVVNGIYTVRVATINQFLLTKISIQR